jgi:taurine--2-oxoglutarate transaminase
MTDENVQVEALTQRQRKHVFYTWSAQDKASPISITGGDGAVFYDADGERWLDFESQVFNCNLGHGESRVTAAIQTQAATLGVAHPAAVYPAKAELGEALNRITPEGMDRFFLCLSGSEAVENALKICRQVTGRSKVIARRRSYHGASMGALSLTGDPRRWPLEPGLWGVLRLDDPYCYRCPYGLKPESCALQCATHLEHLLEMEDPQSIAAVFMEGVTGTNGGFIPPDGYWPKIREICDRHGILLVADEVFTGFGRTGEWFAVNHWDVKPDLITMAKGVTGGYAPLGVVGVSSEIAQHFDSNTLWCGLTGYAHPLSCAAAVAAIEVYEADGLMAASKARGVLMLDLLKALKKDCPVIGDVRGLGLFGTIEFVQDPVEKTPMSIYGRTPEKGSFMPRLAEALRKRRVHAASKWTHLFLAPPLCISETEMREGIELIKSAIEEASECL